MALALNFAQQGRQDAARGSLLATAVLGSTFLAIKGYDYAHMWHQGFRISSNLFGSCYYLLTGFHALHVLSGVILIGYLWRAASGRLAEAIVGRIEYSGLYWHFIDIVWVILFAILCLV
jgi:heme/copper-type cytochrome/quinol oxidase subunit 3